jgi:hypothetical protein
MLIEVGIREVSKGFIVSVGDPHVDPPSPKEDIARTVHQAAFVAGRMVQRMVEETLKEGGETLHD